MVGEDPNLQAHADLHAASRASAETSLGKGVGPSELCGCYAGQSLRLHMLRLIDRASSSHACNTRGISG